MVNKILKSKKLTFERKAKLERLSADLTPEQKLFCQIYSSTSEFFGNGTQSYSQAYHIPINSIASQNTCRTGAYRLMQHQPIQKYINELIDLNGLNDATVDKALLSLILQDLDRSAKKGAIEIYKKEKGKLADKIIHKVELSDEDKKCLKEIGKIIAESKSRE
jgi:hypothetical protein